MALLVNYGKGFFVPCQVICGRVLELFQDSNWFWNHMKDNYYLNLKCMFGYMEKNTRGNKLILACVFRNGQFI